MRKLPDLPNIRQKGNLNDLISGRWTASKVYRVFRHSDFRYYWVGAFVSFSGSWIQSIAEGYFVFQLTHDESKLGLVGFCSSMPVFLFGFVAGSFADNYDRRKLMILTQLLFAIGAIYLAAATYFHFVTYFQILLVATLLGLVSTVDMPVRQAIVSRVVPKEDLAAAVPLTAMTFNAARIIGPAIGSAILSVLGVAWCYFTNGLSFLALIWTAVMIRGDLSVVKKARQPVMDLVFQGFRDTLQETRLRTLFLLEIVTGLFALFYIRLLPAITGEMLGLDQVSTTAARVGLGIATTSIGIGAITGLIIVTTLSESRHLGLIIKLSMTSMGAALILLSFIRTPWLAYPVFCITGMSSIMQLNTTNTLFQLLSPEQSRGRVLAMHIWALNGLSPFGILFFGWLASASKLWPKTHLAPIGFLHFPTNENGTALTLAIGGIVMLGGAMCAWLSKRGLSNLVPER